jgi:hypothetical protein
MTVDWKVNDDGGLDLPVLTSFSIALLPDAMLVVQLRGVPSDAPEGQRLQIGMSAEAARELAAGLLEAADMIGNTPGLGRLN